MSNELITSETRTPLADLRQNALSVPVDAMRAGLQEFAERRAAFRSWLLEQLIEGVHYGYVPGTAPKVGPNGEMLDSRGKVIDQKSWKSKPSFYQAGADFVCDLMGVRPEFIADLAAWEQLGKPVNTFVFTCKLFSKTNGELLGEGHGARKVGQKGGDENNAIKMACKCAKVAAVLNVYGLSDLFTQDEDVPPPHDNPKQKADAPKTYPRHQRISEAQLVEFQRDWQADNPKADKNEFISWCHAATLEDFGAGKLSNWNMDRLQRCKMSLATAREGA